MIRSTAQAHKDRSSIMMALDCLNIFPSSPIECQVERTTTLSFNSTSTTTQDVSQVFIFPCSNKPIDSSCGLEIIENPQEDPRFSGQPSHQADIPNLRVESWIRQGEADPFEMCPNSAWEKWKSDPSIEKVEDQIDFNRFRLLRRQE